MSVYTVVLYCTHALSVRIVRLITVALRITGVLHFRGFINTLTYGSVFGTEQSIHITVDGHISGVSVRLGSTVLHVHEHITCTNNKTPERHKGDFPSNKADLHNDMKQTLQFIHTS